MKIKILHIIDHYNIGGPGKTILNSARFISKNLYKIHVATFLPDGAENTELSRKICSEKIPHCYLRDVRGVSLDNLGCLRAYIQRHHISIIHCHGYKSEIYAYLLKLFDRSTAMVVTYHGWITNNWSQKFIVKVTQMLSFLFDGIIIVADDLMQKIPIFTKTWTKCCVIHNAIVLEDYQDFGSRDTIRRMYRIREKEFVIGVIGRMSPEKGCFEAIDALSYLQQRGIDVRLMMIGDGPLKGELVLHTRRLGLDGRVVFTGHKHPVLPFYGVLDMVVSPSYTEGISNVILEAMALRRPIVATAVGGTPEIIKHGENGILIAPRDALALSDGIESLMRDTDLKHRIVESAYITLNTRFEFRERMWKVEKFYDDVIGSIEERQCSILKKKPISK